MKDANVLIRKCMSLLLVCLLCVNCLSVPAYADAASISETADSQTESTQAISGKSETVQSRTAGVESAQTESGDNVDAQTEKSEADSAPTEADKIESTQNENAGTGNAKTETSTAESSETGNSYPETDATESSEETTSTPEVIQTDISTVNIPAIKDQVYDGNPCQPAIQISGLEEGKDFTVAYSNHTAPGTGVAVITGIGSYKGTVELTFNILLAQPSVNSVSSVSYNSLCVRWSNVPGEDGYCIYRRMENTSWKLVKIVDTDITSWTDTELTCGTKYIYTIRSFIRTEKGTIQSAYDKTGLGAKPIPAAPVLKQTTSGESSVTLTWEKTGGATSYYIYRKTGSNNWTKIASVGSSITSYEDKNVQSGIKYRYTVKGMYNTIHGKYDNSGLEGAVKAAAVTMKSICVTSDGKATVAWAKCSNADGYFVYRRETGGDWKKAGTVNASTLTWSETGLKANAEYWYLAVGYRTLNGKNVQGKTVTSNAIAPRLEYTGEFVRNVTKTVIGTSGAGRNMYSYTIGSGKNHIVITMAIHAWEDNWNKDGITLVKTGNKLISEAAKNVSMLKQYNYSIIIVPMANPDGIYNGTTCNGPGRCTVYRYDNNGNLVKGGVDLNRCFPTGFSAKYTSRNYTGSKALMAKEAVVLKQFIDSSKGSGKNFFIDAHGWYNQTITAKSGTGTLYKAFKKYFPATRPSSFGRGLGYISGYAQSKGYEAALFEFPAVYSETSFNNNGYASKYINTIFYLVKSTGTQTSSGSGSTAGSSSSSGSSTSGSSSGSTSSAGTSKETLVDYKTTTDVNYRSGAGSNYAKKGRLKTGITVKVVNGWSKSASGYTWYKVKINGSYYYMASKYLKKVTTTSSGSSSGSSNSGSSTSKETLVNYKTTTNVNYRSGAGTSYAKKGSLKAGTTVKVVNGWSKSANGYTWYKVKINGSYYYMASRYLKKA